MFDVEGDFLKLVAAACLSVNMLITLMGCPGRDAGP